MRVDAHTFPGKCWLVWHVPGCRVWPRVMWVDDELHQLGELLAPRRIDPATGRSAEVVRQFRRVLILPDSSLVLLDPVEGFPGDDTPTAEGSLVPAPAAASAVATAWKAGVKVGFGAAARAGCRAFFFSSTI